MISKISDARCKAPHADHSFTTARRLSGIGPDSWLSWRYTSLSEVSPSNSFSGIGPDSWLLYRCTV